MASSSSDVKLSQGPSHPCPARPQALGTHSPSERPRSNATSPSSSPCQKQAGWYPSSVSCVGEAEKKKRTRLGTNFFSLEPWRPVILHLALGFVLVVAGSTDSAASGCLLWTRRSRMLCSHDTRFVISSALGHLTGHIYKEKERDTNTLLTIKSHRKAFFAPTSSNSPYIFFIHLACFLVSVCLPHISPQM